MTTKPGYSNPALKAMGISTLRLPSRNWIAFWCLLSIGVGGILYDKNEQKKIRAKYIEIVKPLGLNSEDTWVKPRKLTVFIAPPPSDYLDTSLKVWKRYLKPIIFESGIDYEVFTENKQGLIRNEVAERIRSLRRRILENEEKLRQLENERKWSNRLKNWMNGVYSRDEQVSLEMEQLLAKKFRDEFDFKTVIGIFYNAKAKKVVEEDSIVNNPTLAGGVICCGRGAYKEYIAGLHEGILGPLSPPESVINSIKDELNKKKNTSEVTQSIEDSDQIDAAHVLETNNIQTVSTENTDDNEEVSPVPKPYITPESYDECLFPNELLPRCVRDPTTQIPAIYHQPILMIPIPNLIGFLAIPERIYRFYNTRYQAEKYCQAAAGMVLQKVRPFNEKSDLDLGKSEEEDWPKKWVKKGHERNSEWVQELKGDSRVLSRLSVIDPFSLSNNKNNTK